MRKGWMIAAMALCATNGLMLAQEVGERRVVVTVSYVSSQSVYLDAGKNRTLAPGDTGVVMRPRKAGGRLVITAVSTSSSSARMLVAGDSAAVGDTVIVTTSRRASNVPMAQGPGAPMPPRAGGSVDRTPNWLRGRIAVQYTGSTEQGIGTTLSRPSLLLYLQAGPVAGSDLHFSFHGRLDGALARTISAFGNQGTTLKVYDMTLGLDDPRRWYGFSAGRISSAFVGGLGLVDGVQAFGRAGNLTVGVLGGFQPDYRTSGFDTHAQKLASFANYAWGDGQSSRGSSTIAYGRQLFEQKLDRDFLYLQNTTACGSSLFLYQSTEIDLHAREGDTQRSAFALTNTFLTLSYQPLAWMTANLSYDASRPIEFLESEKSIADSLLDRALRQGVRGSLYFRLPLNIMFSGLGSYRAPAGGLPGGYSAGSGVRMSDIAGTGFSAGGQYLRMKSPYTDGHELTGELEVAPVATLTVSLRWDQFAFIPYEAGDHVVITTWTGSASWNVLKGWYVTMFGDRVMDGDRLQYRLFVEAGFHF